MCRTRELTINITEHCDTNRRNRTQYLSDYDGILKLWLKSIENVYQFPILKVFFIGNDYKNVEKIRIKWSKVYFRRQNINSIPIKLIGTHYLFNYFIQIYLLYIVPISRFRAPLGFLLWTLQLDRQSWKK